MDRIKEIATAVAECEISTDDLVTLRGFSVLFANAEESVEQVGVLGTAEALLAAAEEILGAEVVAGVVGSRPKLTDVLIITHVLRARLAPVMEELQAEMVELKAKLVDFTETVPED